MMTSDIIMEQDQNQKEGAEIVNEEAVGFAKLEAPIEETQDEDSEVEDQAEEVSQDDVQPEELNENDSILSGLDDVDYENETEEDTKPEEEKLTESAAIQRAKEEGRLRKELEATLSERDVSLEEKNGRIEELEEKLKQVSVKQADPTQDPEYQSLFKDVVSEIEDGMLEVDYNGKDDYKNFVAEYSIQIDATKSLPLNERRDKVRAIKEDIAYNLSGLSKEDWDDDIDGEKSNFLKQGNDIYNLAKDIAPDLKRLQEISEDIKNNSQEYELNQKASQYKEIESNVRETVEGLLSLNEDALEADPYSLQSIAFSEASNEKNKKKVESLISDLVLAEAGGKKFSAIERKALLKQGKTESDISDYEKQFAKKAKKNKEKFMAVTFQAVLTQAKLKKLAEENAELKRKVKTKEKSEKAKDGLLDTPTKRGDISEGEKVGFDRFL